MSVPPSSLARDARDTEILRLVNGLSEAMAATIALINRELAELRALVADLDDATPSRAAFEELHSRVDVLEAGLGELRPQVAILMDRSW